MPFSIEKKVGDGRKVFEVYSKEEVDQILYKRQRLTERAQEILSGGGGTSGNSWTTVTGKPFKTVNTDAGQFVISGDELSLPQDLGINDDVEFESIDINGSVFVNSNRDITSRQITVAGVNKWNSNELLVVNSNDTDLSLAIGQHGGSSTYLRIVPENASGALFNNDLSFNFADVRWEVDGDFHVLDDIDVGNTISMNGNEFVDSSRNVSAGSADFDGLVRISDGTAFALRIGEDDESMQGHFGGRYTFYTSTDKVESEDGWLFRTLTGGSGDTSIFRINSAGGVDVLDGSMTIADTLTINSQLLFDLNKEQNLSNDANVNFQDITELNYVDGWLAEGGTGYGITQDPDASQQWNAQFNDLLVRGTLKVFEFIVKQIAVLGGTEILSVAVAEADSVTGSAGSEVVSITDPRDFGGTSLEEDDLVIVQRVDINDTTIVKQEFRTVSTKTATDVTFTSTSGAPAPSDPIEEGDIIVAYGNLTDPDRQNIIYRNVDASGGSVIDRVQEGIDSYNQFSSPFETTRVAKGDLNGFADYTEQVWGFFAGDNDTDKVTIDASNGIRFLDETNTVAAQLSGGLFRIGNATHYLQYDVSESSLDLDVENFHLKAIDANGGLEINSANRSFDNLDGNEDWTFRIKSDQTLPVSVVSTASETFADQILTAESGNNDINTQDITSGDFDKLVPLEIRFNVAWQDDSLAAVELWGYDGSWNRLETLKLIQTTDSASNEDFTILRDLSDYTQVRIRVVMFTGGGATGDVTISGISTDDFTYEQYKPRTLINNSGMFVQVTPSVQRQITGVGEPISVISSWNNVSNKPFDTVDTSKFLDITNDELSVTNVDWDNDIDNRPFTTLGTDFDTLSGQLFIVGYNNSNWDTAFGWGDHGAVGYLEQNEEITIEGDANGTGRTTINISLANNVVGSAEITNDVINGQTAIPSLQSSDRLLITDTSEVGDPLRRVSISQLDSYFGAVDELNDLSDVFVSSPTEGHILRYDDLGDDRWENVLLSDEVHSIVGGMVSGNTETLITVTYQSGDDTLDFVVDNDLSNYDNSTSGFISGNQTITIDGDADGSGETSITLSLNADVVGSNELAQEAITGQANTTSLDSSDEFLINDFSAGGLRAITVGNVQSYMQNNLSFTSDLDWEDVNNKPFDDISSSHFTLVGSDPNRELNISGYNNSDWDTAFSWGDHSTEGYLTGNETITISGDASGSGSTSINISLNNNVVGSAEITNDVILGNADIPSLASTDKLMISDDSETGDPLRKVTIGQLDAYFGGGGSLALDDLTDVEASSPSNGDIIQFGINNEWNAVPFGDYVPASGGTFTGDVTIDGDGSDAYLTVDSGGNSEEGIKFARNGTIDSRIYVDTGENLVYHANESGLSGREHQFYLNGTLKYQIGETVQTFYGRYYDFNHDGNSVLNIRFNGGTYDFDGIRFQSTDEAGAYYDFMQMTSGKSQSDTEDARLTFLNVNEIRFNVDTFNLNATLDAQGGTFSNDLTVNAQAKFARNNHQILIEDTANSKQWSLTTVSDQNIGFYEDASTNRWELDTSGNVTATDFIATSDARIKENESPITNALESLRNITPYHFDKNGERKVGYIAQNVEEFTENVVFKVERNGYMDFRTMNMFGMQAYNTQAIKEVDDEVTQLKNRVQELEEEVRQLGGSV